jgi:hypothetical protein
MRAIVPIYCMTRVVAAGNAYGIDEGSRLMKMTGSAGVRYNDDDPRGGSFKHS